jgi:hypothetical protein
MSPEDRDRYMAKYKAGGPAGRPAPEGTAA